MGNQRKMLLEEKDSLYDGEPVLILDSYLIYSNSRLDKIEHGQLQ